MPKYFLSKVGFYFAVCVQRENKISILCYVKNLGAGAREILKLENKTK